MKVLNIMTAPALACKPADTLHTAAEIMWQVDCGCVPVTDERRRPVGMITDRDICIAAHLEGQPLRSRTVGSAMSNEVQVCAPHDSLQQAAATMRRTRYRRLPVVDAEGHLVGVLSLNDLVLAAQTHGCLSPEEIAHTLAAICRPGATAGSADPS